MRHPQLHQQDNLQTISKPEERDDVGAEERADVGGADVGGAES